MALKACPECAHKVSTTAKACPSCGYDLERKRTEDTAMWGCAIVALLVMAVFAFPAALSFFAPTKPTKKQSRPRTMQEASTGQRTTKKQSIPRTMQEARTGQRTTKSQRDPEKVLYAKRVDNIRSGPGTQHEILRKTKEFEKLHYERKEGRWYKLFTGTGPAAWVHDSVVHTKREGERLVRERAALQEDALAYSVLRGPWKPYDEENSLGLEILVDEDLTKDEIVDLLRNLAEGKAGVSITVWTDRRAYENAENDVYGDEFDKHLICGYTRNMTIPRAFYGVNSITWLQKTGKFAHLAGTETKM